MKMRVAFDLHVEALADELKALARLKLLVPVEPGFLDVPLGHGAVHLLDGRADDAAQLADFGAELGLAQLRARARFVDQIDRLVRQEPVGDVAARLVDRRFDGFGRGTRRDGTSRTGP